MKIILAGANGFCGRLLAPYLSERGHEIVALVRRDIDLPGVSRSVLWDGETSSDRESAIDGADAIVNLCGKSVNCRYTPDNCAEIFASRLSSTRALGRAVSTAKNPPNVWLNASSATIYRDARDRSMDEHSGEIGSGFSVDVVKQWEAELFSSPTPNTRKVALRSAMVFDKLPKNPVESVWDAYESVARLGLAGPMAGGGAFVSFVHGRDFCRATEFLLARGDISGPVNLCAPNPLPNREFLAALRAALRVPIGLPSAAWMLKLGARVRGTDAELLLKSRRVEPKKLLDAGFSFDFPTWPETAREISVRE